MNIPNKIKGILWVAAAGLMASCTKETDKGFLSPALRYPNPTINVTVGASLIQSGAMVTDESTKPLEFAIDAIRSEDGKVNEDIMKYRVDTYFWGAEYTGKEKTVDDINKKRTKVSRPAIDINPINGLIVIYPEATDSTILKKGKYILDIKVSNSGGTRIMKGALTINVTAYAGPYVYSFLGVDGNVKAIDVKFEQLEKTGNKLHIYVQKKDGSPVNPKDLVGYDYSSDPAVKDLKDWRYLGLNNPTKYTEFPDHLELELAAYPLPIVKGQRLTIDMYNNSSINGKYLNFWFNFAIFNEGLWKITIKLDY